MAFTVTSQTIGAQPLGDNATTAAHAIGSVSEGTDPSRGYGKFIYLRGVAGTVVGSVVTYNPETGTTVLATTRARGLAAVAMAATVGNQFGWYQREGSAAVRALAVVAGATPYATATPGVLDDAVVAGDLLYGATFTSADGTPAAGLALCALSNPYFGDTDNA